MADKDNNKETPQAPRPSREEAARHVIQEYIDDLKAWIDRLRRKMN